MSIHIDVQKNLENIQAGVEKFERELVELESKRKEIKDELLRLEGCRITFEGFYNVGLRQIHRLTNGMSKTMWEDGGRTDAEYMNNRYRDFGHEENDYEDNCVEHHEEEHHHHEEEHHHHEEEHHHHEEEHHHHEEEYHHREEEYHHHREENDCFMPIR